jgi:hypothetical protein
VNSYELGAMSYETQRKYVLTDVGASFTTHDSRLMTKASEGGVCG